MWAPGPAWQSPSDGLPVVSYHDELNGDLKVAKLTADPGFDTEGQYGWSVQTVYEGAPFAFTSGDSDGGDIVRDGDAGEHTRLLADGSNLYLAFHDKAEGSLRLAESTDGGVSWSVSRVAPAAPDGVRNVGAWPSLLVNGGDLVVSYHDVGNQDLVVATRDGNGSWTTEVVDAGEFVGADSELFLRGAPCRSCTSTARPTTCAWRSRRPAPAPGPASSSAARPARSASTTRSSRSATPGTAPPTTSARAASSGRSCPPRTDLRRADRRRTEARPSGVFASDDREDGMLRRRMTDRSRWVRAVGMLLACWLSGPALAGLMVVDVLDVGQGDAILVRAEGRAVLVDAGPGDAIVGQLERLGVRRLDLAVASHAHADHIGGMDAVLRAVDTRFYMDNRLPHTTGTYGDVMKTVEDRRVTYVAADPGREITLGDDVVMTVLAPPATHFTETRSDHNSNSVVLWIRHGTVDLLLTGDAEAPTEAWLVANKVPDVEVLKVPHHGSDHSSTAPFLQAVSPEVAVISCGRDNKYDHPGAEALSRLAAAGARVYRTDTMGQVRIVSDGTAVEVTTGSIDRFGASLPVPSPPAEEAR